MSYGGSDTKHFSRCARRKGASRAFEVQAKKIARYHLIQQIGKGGMGEIFLAHDPNLDRRVALKFLPPHLGYGPVSRGWTICSRRLALGCSYLSIND